MKRSQKKKKSASIIDSSVNQHILNVITPSGIDYTKSSASLGENEGKLFFISKYPTDGVDYGWLSDICNLEGTITQIGFHYTDPKLMTDAFNKQISELKSEKELAKQESEIQICQKKIDDLKEMIDRISVREEPVGYMNITLFIQDQSIEKLNSGREKRINTILATNGCNMRLLKYRQIQAMESVAPYGLPNEDVMRKGNRNIPISTFTGGFPMADSGINDKGGHYIGKTLDGRVVFLNQWLRGKDRVNSNWFISGKPGLGKSTFLKFLVICEIAYGRRFIMIDPEEEYHDIANHPDINGDIIDCGGGLNGRINPFEFRSVPIVKEEDLREDESAEDYIQFVDGSPMALHIQFLRNFFKLYFGKENYTTDVKSTLEDCLVKTYEKKNINWNTDPSTLKSEDYPYFQDLYDCVCEELENKDMTEYRRSSLEKTQDLLRSATMGADSFLWNGPTTIKSKSKFVVLNTSKLHEMDDNVKNAQNLNICSWGWNEMSKDRTEKVDFGVDEGYLCVDPDYPELMKFLRNTSKRDRKYEGSLFFITHGVVDILDPAVKRFGQAIIDNACYKFIMGCDGKNLEETAELFNLTSREITFLAAQNRGKGILFAGGVRQTISIDVPKRILDMMGSAGGR